MPSANACWMRVRLVALWRWTSRAIAWLCSESSERKEQMTLANIPVGLDRAESACPQLPANVADGFAFRPVFGKLHQQAIHELVAGFVAVDVGRDHFDRA